MSGGNSFCVTRLGRLNPPFVPLSCLTTSRWLTKEELEALLVETMSAHDVRTCRWSPSWSFALSDVLVVPQYNRFVQLMERLLSLPYCGTEEEFVQRYRRQLEAQSRNQMVPPLERDERGVAFSTSEGRPPAVCTPPP